MSNDSRSISVRVDSDVLDEFDKSIKKAQLDNKIALDVNRSEAIRRLIIAGIDDTSLFEETDSE